MTKHVFVQAAGRDLCVACEEPWPCETAMLAFQVERLNKALLHALSCTQLRCRGCRIVLDEARRPAFYRDSGSSTTNLVEGL